jgi:hypothetical protein
MAEMNLTRKMPLLCITLVGLLLVSCQKERNMLMPEVPGEILTYISAHFLGQSLITTTRLQDGLSLQYKTVLSNNMEVMFNRRRDAIWADGMNRRLPMSIMPAAIETYLIENYEDQFVVYWERLDREHRVRLNTGPRLRFDRHGNFLRAE